ncbi:MAG TPA: helix-turn-helix transcriptional regulator [Phycisphaerae bacterium]|nr:helix-turn-helix transcriptional regulator [Phycisphaerae bacterium]
MKRTIQVKSGSGNVFTDLGLSNADDLSIQVDLVRLIYLRIRELGLTQAQAAKRLGLKQPDVSKLMNGRHTGFSAERLFRALNALDEDVQIIVSKKPPRARRDGKVTVTAA